MWRVGCWVGQRRGQSRRSRGRRRVGGWGLGDGGGSGTVINGESSVDNPFLAASCCVRVQNRVAWPLRRLDRLIGRGYYNCRNSEKCCALSVYGRGAESESDRRCLYAFYNNSLYRSPINEG